MEFKEHSVITRQLGEMTAVYNTKGGITSFTCVPTNKLSSIAPRKLFREFMPRFKHICLEPMVQIALMGDELQRDFSAGTSLCGASTAMNLRAKDQIVNYIDGRTEVSTYLEDDKGICVKHIISQVDGYNAAEARIEITNNSASLVTVELAASFAISGLTPFAEENDANGLVLHRLQNNWSGEGRKESVAFSHYNLEDSWSSLGIRDERIGQLGSMSARAYLPFVAVEDTKNNVTWAVQMQTEGSWQIESFAKNCAFTICGGAADYLYGHWRKKLEVGECFKTTTAYFTVVNGDLTKACAALTNYQNTYFNITASEQDLPVIYNEFLYSWGDPNINKLRPQMECAKKLGAKYFVVDAGWFCEHCDSELGNWNVNVSRFPKGLKGFKEELDNFGYTLGGVWFEFEGATTNSTIMSHEDWLLKLDGNIIKRNNRVLLDFRVPAVIDYLSKKVINTLLESGLRYIKIDYNENVGFGVDGAESMGEGLRQHMEGVIAFYKKLKTAIPDLIMEVCSSGGMRHEPLFMSLASMVSFSDAHEGVEGVVIAADLHRYMLPRIMQIWAYIKAEYSASDTKFTMVKAMLGRICLSGDLAGVSSSIKQIVKSGVEYYQTIKDIIKNGETTLIDTDDITSLRFPKGVIRLTRVSNDKKRMICYGFSLFSPASKLLFNTNGYHIISSYGDGKASDGIIETSGERWSGTVMLLEKNSNMT